MTISVAGFILRSKDRHKTARFYAELGLSTGEHQHGGPKHHEITPTSDECVMEVYSHSPTFSQDTLMLNVDSIDVALGVAKKFGIEKITDIRDMRDARFVYITDTDGRSVMLIEKK